MRRAHSRWPTRAPRVAAPGQIPPPFSFPSRLLADWQEYDFDPQKLLAMEISLSIPLYEYAILDIFLGLNYVYYLLSIGAESRGLRFAFFCVDSLQPCSPVWGLGSRVWGFGLAWIAQSDSRREMEVVPGREERERGRERGREGQRERERYRGGENEIERGREKNARFSGGCSRSQSPNPEPQTQTPKTRALCRKILNANLNSGGRV